MRKTRTLVLLENAMIVGHDTAGTGIPTGLQLPPSGWTPIVNSGGKCEHGVYIPAPDLETGRSPACSVCYPYDILASTWRKI